MLSSRPSSPPSPSRASHEPIRRLSDTPAFFMHEDHDSFYHSRKSSIDIEGGCLVPSDSADGAMPDLTSKKTSRRGIYAEYRRWFRQSSPRASAIQLPLAEKSAEYLEPRQFECIDVNNAIQTVWGAIAGILEDDSPCPMRSFYRINASISIVAFGAAIQYILPFTGYTVYSEYDTRIQIYFFFGIKEGREEGRGGREGVVQ
ncbi:hypothetical protein B0H13DRAFT_1881312 [Mycena leptocephala]|nr:hypothetical protein B0H13DRAFT_1881312 [Mycena leptocephala]